MKRRRFGATKGRTIPAGRHGATAGGRINGTPEYRVWKGMWQRCTDPNATGWEVYGGRGIRVADEWRSFEKFLSAMGPRPTLQHQIDRKDPNGNYTAANCHWVLPKENARNRRNTKWVLFRGKQERLAELAERFGVDVGVAHARLRIGWSVECAVTTKPIPAGSNLPAEARKQAPYIEFRGERLLRKDLAARFGLKDSTVESRLRLGWDLERVLNTPPMARGAHLKSAYAAFVAAGGCGGRKPRRPHNQRREAAE